MIPEKRKRYLIEYKFGQDLYTDIGIYTGETWLEKDGLEYKFKVYGGTLLVTEEEITKCIDNPHDGSTLDNFLLLEKLKAWEKCADRLSIYAEEIQCTVVDRALWEVACEDVAEYKRLKNEAQSNE